MKKALYVFLGCIVASVIAVGISSCKSNGAEEGNIVGTWVWESHDYYYGSTTQTAILRSDGTGRITSLLYGGEYSEHMDFDYKYDKSKQKLTIWPEYYDYSVYFYVEWKDANTIYIYEAEAASDYYSDYYMGPFKRK